MELKYIVCYSKIILYEEERSERNGGNNMSFIKEIDKGTNILRFYTSNQITNNIEAVKWLYAVKDMEGLTVNYICYTDMMNRQDEGNDSIELSADVSLSEMIDNYNNRDVHFILINGEYKNAPVGIGVDLRDRTVRLGIRKKIPADIKSIEKKLQLN